MNLSDKLKELGIPEDQFVDINRTLINAQKNFQKAGFNVSQEAVNSYFVTQYTKAKEKGAENPRKAAFEAIFKAKFPPIKKGAKIGRNTKCPCGSEKKYKNCCLK